MATARKVVALNSLGRNENVQELVMDVTDESQVRTAVDAALAHFWHIDVLVNNAGYGLLGAVEEASASEVEKVFRTNVFGLLNVTRAVLPGMRKRRSGHIFYMSSVAGFISRLGWGLYCSTKYAVEAITAALYGELTPLGIHVTAIEPGYFRTDFLDTSSLQPAAARISDYDSSAGKTREQAEERNHQQLGDPKKLAQVLIQIATVPQPPVRLPMGTETAGK